MKNILFILFIVLWSSFSFSGVIHDSSSDYTESIFIVRNKANTDLQIEGNLNLLDKAMEYSWSGTGTLTDPIKMTYSTSNLASLTILNTNLFIELNGEEKSAYIHFVNVSNALIKNIIVTNDDQNIIEILQSSNIVISNINISYSKSNIAITVFDSNYVTIKDSIVSNTTGLGIHLSNTNHSQIINSFLDHGKQNILRITEGENNTVLNNYFSFGISSGLFLQNTNQVLFINNTSFSNKLAGIYSAGSENLLIYNNTFHNNRRRGIWCDSTSNSSYIKNIIVNNLEDGIIIGGNNNSVSYNEIKNNTGTGISFTEKNTIPNKFSMNNVIGNKMYSGSQIFDSRGESFVDSNFWDNWVSPDNDNNGIVDSPYIVTTLSNSNQDSNPLAVPVDLSSVFYNLSSYKWILPTYDWIFYKNQPSNSKSPTSNSNVDFNFSVFIVGFFTLLIIRKKKFL